MERYDAPYDGKTTLGGEPLSPGSTPGILGHDPIAEPQISDEPVNILPRVNSTVNSVFGEAEKRLTLLSSVSVDEKGVAHCVDSETGTETLLAAVMIDSQKTATLAPVMKSATGELLLPVPPSSPTRFGFFIGQIASSDLSAAFRIGIYPGNPLVTEAQTDDSNREIFIGLRGFKPDEIDELR